MRVSELAPEKEVKYCKHVLLSTTSMSTYAQKVQYSIIPIVKTPPAYFKVKKIPDNTCTPSSYAKLCT